MPTRRSGYSCQVSHYESGTAMRKAEITIVPLTTVHPGSRRPHVSPNHRHIRAHCARVDSPGCTNAFAFSLSLSFSSLPSLSVCAHENLFRNCIKGTLAPGSLSDRFRSGRVQSGLVSAPREIPPFAPCFVGSLSSLASTPVEFSFGFRPWTAAAAEAARLSEPAFARVAPGSSLAHRRI